MKNYLYTVLAILSLVFVPYTVASELHGAKLGGAKLGGSQGVVSCATLSQGVSGGSTGSYNLGSNIVYTYFATKYTANGDTICAIGLYLEPNLNPTQTLTPYICEDDAGDEGPADLPGSVIATGTAIDASKLAAGENEVIVDLSEVTPTNGNSYHVVIKATGVDAANYVKWHHNNTAAVKSVANDADGSGDWALTTSFTSMKYNLYKR